MRPRSKSQFPDWPFSPTRIARGHSNSSGTRARATTLRTPLDLHARYQLYEFDADAHPGEALEPPAGEKGIDVREWTRGAGLRQIQDVELRPSDDLALTPADTLSTPTWEAWYPSAARRLALRRARIASGT